MLLSVDATCIFVFVSFVIFLFLMHLICYKPIMRIINEREKLLFKNKETVNKANQKKEELLKEIETEISNAKFEGSKVLKNTANLNNQKEQEALNIKKAEISNNLDEFEKSLDNNSKIAKENLKQEIEIYVKQTVSKVLNIPSDEIPLNISKIDEILK